MKNIIWCEVTCGRCGAISSKSGFYSPERIKLLKRDTKDWIDVQDFGVLCPECVNHLIKSKQINKQVHK